MSAQVDLFIDAIRSDQNLQNEVATILDAGTDDEAYNGLVRFAATKGFEVTREELETAMDNIELSEEELEVIAGGGKHDGNTANVWGIE